MRLGMKKLQIRNSLLLVLTALIWGVAFVAQSEGGDAVGSFSFNGIRSFIGGIVLIPVIMLLDRIKPSDRKPHDADSRRTLLIGGICCGTVLFLASSAQQIGINMGTAAGKAGFLTACYILLVPLFGLFFKKKCGWNIWIGIVIAVAGLYLLCMNGEVEFQKSDLMVLLCAVLFAGHILIVDHFSPLVDGVRMSCIQFLVCGLLSVVPMFVLDMKHSVPGIKEWAIPFGNFSTWIPILYAGVLSCGVAYTLQIIGQNGLNPTFASMLMSLESVFSVIAGWLILGEKMGARQLAGCGLIFAAIILAQLPVRKKSQKGIDMPET